MSVKVGRAEGKLVRLVRGTMAPDAEMNNLSIGLPCWTAKQSTTRKQVSEVGEKGEEGRGEGAER